LGNDATQQTQRSFARANLLRPVRICYGEAIRGNWYNGFWPLLIYLLTLLHSDGVTVADDDDDDDDEVEVGVERISECRSCSITYINK